MAAKTLAVSRRLRPGRTAGKRRSLFTWRERGSRLFITLDRRLMRRDDVLAMLQRLRVEELATQAAFDTGVLGVADQITEQWWKRNKARFLQDTHP